MPTDFAGAALVARGSAILLANGYGKLAGTPLRSDSRFWIASAGKQFTAAAIMRLVETGKVGLDDPLRRFFPRAPSDKAAITVRQLLSHSSGFGQSYVSEERRARAQAVEAMLADPLKGPPGSGFRYSNTNIQLAAAIVEIVSGQSYADFVQRQLWHRAGLRSTGFAGSAGAARVVAIKGELPARLKRSYWGEQGIYSSATDLYRWYRALATGRVLRPASVQTMFAPATKIGEGYATLGWFRGRTERGNDYIFVRGNEDFGANSVFYAYPKQHIVIVILSHAGDQGDLSWSRTVLQSLQSQLGL